MPIPLSPGSHLPTVAVTGPSQTITTSGSAQSFSAVGKTRIVRVSCLADAWYSIGGTAAIGGATSVLLPAGVVEYVEINPSQVVSVIQDTAAGKFNLVECPLYFGVNSGAKVNV